MTTQSKINKIGQPNNNTKVKIVEFKLIFDISIDVILFIVNINISRE